MKKDKAYKLAVAQTNFRRNYKKKKRNRKISSFFIWGLVLIAAVVACGMFFFNFSICFDAGMHDEVGNVIVTNRLSYMLDEPERGDIISFYYEDDLGRTKVLQRRLIAFPGETVEIIDGALYIDETEYSVNDWTSELSSDVESVVVSEGSYFVLCDDLEEGPDSRDGLYVAMSAIIGEELISFALPGI